METPKQIVYFFHMPLFFFLSGYVFSGAKYDTKTFLLKKFKRLLIPYYVLGIFMYISKTINNLAYVGYDIHQLKKQDQINMFWEFILQNRFGTLWYISVLFIMNVVMYFLLKLCREKTWIVFLISLVMLGLGINFYHHGGGAVIFNIDILFMMMVFFVLGFWAKQLKIFQKDLFEKYSTGWFLLFAAVTLLIGFFNLYKSGQMVNIFYCEYGILPLAYLSSITGIIAIIGFCYNANVPPIEYIGKNSMLFYAWHQCMIFPLVQWQLFYKGLFQTSAFFDRLATSLLCIGLSFLILLIPTALIRKTKFAWIFGL